MLNKIINIIKLKLENKKLKKQLKSCKNDKELLLQKYRDLEETLDYTLEKFNKLSKLSQKRFKKIKELREMNYEKRN